jgi:hypothetical protein
MFRLRRSSKSETLTACLAARCDGVFFDVAHLNFVEKSTAEVWRWSSAFTGVLQRKPETQLLRGFQIVKDIDSALPRHQQQATVVDLDHHSVLKTFSHHLRK